MELSQFFDSMDDNETQQRNSFSQQERKKTSAVDRSCCSRMKVDELREYVGATNLDIFDVIEKAIMMAASDWPEDFKLRRAQIAELLFASKPTCSGCQKFEPTVVPGGELPRVNTEADTYESGVEAGRSKGGPKESAVVNCSAALYDEINKESEFYGEVLKIKKVLDNNHDDETLLSELLWKLQSMPITVEILKTSDIGKSVNILQKHGSRKIRNLARSLIKDWRGIVDSWVEATKAIEEIPPETVKTCVVEDLENGMPSPPLDERAFLSLPPSMDLSKFFDGMDDDGNPCNCGDDLDKNRETGINKAIVEKRDTRKIKLVLRRKNSDQHQPRTGKRLEEYYRNSKLESKTSFRPQSRPLINYESTPNKPKLALEPKANSETKSLKNIKNVGSSSIEKKFIPSPEKKQDGNKDDDSIHVKLEATKRKLHERYQEVKNAKKRRMVKVLKLSDLPQQSRRSKINGCRF